MGMCPLYSSDETQVDDGTEAPPDGWDPGTVPTSRESEEVLEGTEEYEHCKLLFELRIKEGGKFKSAPFPKGASLTSFRVDFTNRPIGCQIKAVENINFEEVSCFLVIYETPEKGQTDTS